MRRAIFMLLALFSGVIVLGGQKIEPVWTLSNNKIPAELQYGKIKRVENKIILENGAAFAVPATAFVDQKNFTVKVTVSINKLIDNTVFTAMKKQGEADNGFSFSTNYRIKPSWARQGCLS